MSKIYLFTYLLKIKMCLLEPIALPELIEFEGLDPGPPRPRPELAPRPLPPRREPLSSLPKPRGLWSRSEMSSGSEALDSSEFVPAVRRPANGNKTFYLK